jgi:uncharacterized protein YukE
MAQRLHVGASGVEGQQDFATDTAPRGVGPGGSAWEGLAASAYLGAIAPFAAETSTAYTGLTRGAKALTEYADKLTELKSRHRELVDRNSDLGRAITNFEAEVRSYEGQEVDQATLDRLNARSAELFGQLRDYTTANDQLRTDTTATEQALVSALGKIGGVQATQRAMAAGGYDPVTARQSALRKAGPGTQPQDLGTMASDERARWWASLSPEERDAVIQEFPEYIGPGLGIPGTARDVANRQMIHRDVLQSRAIIDTTAAVGPGRADGPGVKEAKKTLENAEATLRGLETAEEYADGKVPVQLLLYDPRAFGGDGKGAISIGNIDTAKNVAFNVPGMTTTVGGSMVSNVENAGRLFDAADGTNGNTASVAWIGYDAPSGPLGGLTEVPSSAQADAGGDLLADELEGFTASRDQLGLGQGTGPDDHLNLSVIGHSYGSTTVSYAGDEGRLADDVDSVTLIGSPGAGPIDHASEFGIGNENVYVGAASNDPVTWIGPNLGPVALGTDPAMDTFEATRFQAQGGSTQFPIGPHSSYYEEDSESIQALRSIVLGEGEAIVPEEHRHRRWLFDLGWKDPAGDRE